MLRPIREQSWTADSTKPESDVAKGTRTPAKGPVASKEEPLAAPRGILLAAVAGFLSWAIIFTIIWLIFH